MSALGTFIVVFGLLIIVSRAPLVVAPERARSMFMQIMATPTRMRLLGLFISTIGALAAWAGSTQVSPTADFVNTAGIIIVVFGAGIVIPFALPVSKAFRETLEAMSTSFLRSAGILAILLGAWIVWYGVGL